VGLLLLLLRRAGGAHRLSAIAADIASGGWLRGARGARLLRGLSSRPLRRIRTDSDIVVFRAGSLAAPELVVKLAWTPVGADRLAAQLRSVASLRAMPRLGDWTLLLPDVVEVGAVRGRPYVVERALPGVDGRRFARDGRREAALEAVAVSMRPLYDASATDVVADDVLLRAWVHQRLDRVSRQRLGAAREAFARPRGALDAALLGRRIRTGSVHGDLWLGNVLMDPESGKVTGLLDWEHASAVGPVAADLAHLVLSTRSLAEGEQLGAVAARLIDGRDSLSEAELELVAGWGMSPRDALLLAWLQHLDGRLAQSTLHPHGRWLRRNADPVLEVLRA
jgi:aminoglycoside phosphotransferase